MPQLHLPHKTLSGGLGDAQQAIRLIGEIYKIVEPAVLEANNKINERSSLKKFLGPWWKEAVALWGGGSKHTHL